MKRPIAAIVSLSRRKRLVRRTDISAYTGNALFFPKCISGLLIVLVSLLTGCSKLKETPYSSIFTSNFYKTGSDAEAALVAAYDPLASMYRGPATIMASDFSADQCGLVLEILRTILRPESDLLVMSNQSSEVLLLRQSGGRSSGIE